MSNLTSEFFMGSGSLISLARSYTSAPLVLYT